MNGNMALLAKGLTVPDQQLYTRWAEFLKVPTKTRVHDALHKSYLRLLTSQMTCIAQKQLRRLEEPFNRAPVVHTDKRLPEIPSSSFDRYKALMMKVQLTAAQR